MSGPIRLVSGAGGSKPKESSEPQLPKGSAEWVGVLRSLADTIEREKWVDVAWGYVVAEARVNGEDLVINRWTSAEDLIRQVGTLEYLKQLAISRMVPPDDEGEE